MGAPAASRRLHYAWIVAGVAFLTLLGSAGFRSAPGVLIVPLQDAFGWSRAAISGAVSLNLLLFGFTGIFAAALMDRFGVRAVIVAALLLVSLGAILTTIMHSTWQLYLFWGVLVGVGTGAMASVLSAIVATRWFVKQRGLVIGLLTASLSTGQLVFLPSLAWLAVHVGWRAVSFTVAGGALLVTPLVALFMRNRPADVGLSAYGAEADEAPPPVQRNPLATSFGILGRSWRNPDFWCLCGSYFICGASTNGLIGTHLIPASMDHGVAEVAAASMLALIGIFDILGTTLSGWLTDRLDSRWLLFWYYGLRGLSLLFLPYAFGQRYFGMLVFIVFYGLDWVATVPPTVALANRQFGPAAGPVIYGWAFAAHQLGAATAAYGAGAVRTWFGDYQLAFMTSGLLCLLAAGIVTRIGRGRLPDALPQPLTAGAD